MENSKYIKDDQNMTEMEVLGLQNLLGTPIRSKEERIILESKLNELLPRLSNTTVVQLINNKYVYREFERRIETGSEFELGTLFLLAEPLSGASFRRKSERKYYELISKGIQNRTPLAPLSEVVTVIIENAQTPLDANTSLLDEVLSYRDDVESIVNAVLESTSDRGMWTHLDDYLAGLKARASNIRNQRELMYK